MRSQKIGYLSTAFAAFFMAVFTIGSINQSISMETPEKSNTNASTVINTSPSDDEEDVTRNIVIEITFSEEMDSISIKNSAFTLMQGTESVAGNLEYSGKKAMFTAQRSLKAESKYTAKITTASNQSDDDSNKESDYKTPQKNDMEWSFTTGGNSDPVETIDLGSAAEYVILARSSIHNDSTSDITGEKGFNPDSKSAKDKANKTANWLNNEDVDKEAVRRDTTHKTHKNREYSASKSDSVTNAYNLDMAFEDMMTAYTDAAERSPVDYMDYKFVQSDDHADSTWDDNSVDHNEANSTDSTDVGYTEDYSAEPGMDKNTIESSITLEPGIYKWNDSVQISTNITLSGSAEDVWIFQISEDLTVSPDVEITLADGAVAENIFWQVAGEVNIGATAHIEGIILTQKGITLKNGATLNGRMLVQTDITLDDNTIIEPKILSTVQRTSSNK
jgi:hypothetical protein